MLIVRPLVEVPSSSLATRSCISFAALLVKVMAPMFDGLKPPPGSGRRFSG